MLSFIIPTRFLSNETFQKARYFVYRNCRIVNYLDAKMPFESASVEANAFIGVKNSNSENISTYSYDLRKKVINKLSKMNYKFIKQTELIAEQKRITAEKKAEYDSIEKERITQLEKDRMIVAAPLSSFIADFENIVFADLAEYKFSNLISKALRLKNEQEHKQEQIKVENERLKREVEEKERVAKEYEQRREAEKQKNHDRMKALTSIGLIFNGELFVYRDINFNWTDISCMNDHEFSKALEGADVRMTEIKLDEQKEKEKEHAKQEAERLDIQRLENELNLKIKAEQKAESDRLSEIEAELKKDDYVKVKDLLNDLESLKTKYSFKLPDNQKMYSGVGVLLDKIKNHIK